MKKIHLSLPGQKRLYLYSVFIPYHRKSALIVSVNGIALLDLEKNSMRYVVNRHTLPDLDKHGTKTDIDDHIKQLVFGD